MTAPLIPYWGTSGVDAALTQISLSGEITPFLSVVLAREIAAMPPGNSKHRCFDNLINVIARQHGHGEAVDIFEAAADGAAYHQDDAA